MEKLKVDTTSSAYDIMRPRWDLANALLGGTEALRAGGETWLPRYPSEEVIVYDLRLKKATLLNYFERTAGELTSKVFSKDIEIEGAPAWFDDVIEDADRQGNNVTVFARDVFHRGLTHGVSCVYVDHTKVAQGSTLEQERAAGAGPYWVHVPIENVIAAYAEMVNGRETFTHVRIRESETIREGFGERTIHRVRVLEPGRYELWEQDSETGVWSIVDEGITSLGVVPVAFWYAGVRSAVQVAKPPLLDLAYLNLAHYQSASDQRHCLTVSRFPMLAGSGVPDEAQGKVVVGPNTVLSSSDPNGRWYYVEPTGAAIEAGRKDLEDLQNEMALVSIELQVKRTGQQTATSQAIQEGKAVSMIEALATSFSDFLELCAYYTGLYKSQQIKVSMRLNSDLGIDLANKADVDALLKARQAGEISRPALLREFKRRGILGSDFDAEEDADELDAEAPNLTAQIPALDAESDSGTVMDDVGQ